MSHQSYSTPPEDVASLRFVPCLRLRKETLLSHPGAGALRSAGDIAVMDLVFDYGGTVVSGCDGDRKGDRAPLRDPDGERRARFALERYGAVDLDCVPDLAARLAAPADYVVDVDGDARGVCVFLASVLPRLQRLGWRTEIAADFPWRINDAHTPWYASVEPDRGRPDWFNLELGIEVDGRRVNLLPALLALLEQIPHSARLESILPTGGRPFALAAGDGSYVLVPPDRLRILMKVLRELYDAEADAGAGGPLGFPAARAASLAELDRGFGGPGGEALRWRGATAVRDRALSLSSRKSGDATALPRGLCATLRPYQREGLAFLQHLRAQEVGGILADDMGLGKTLQTIAHVQAEKEAGRLDGPALVVAPTSLVGNWRRELARFAPGLRVLVIAGKGRRGLWQAARRADVALVTYATLLRDEELAAAAGPFHLVVLDEAQNIKNPRGRCRRVIMDLKARHRLCLTGTPIENNLTELWSLFDFVAPGLLGDEEWFRARFALPIEREGDAERLRVLRDQVAPFILRRRKEEVARELPAKTELFLPVELAGAQRDLYESLRVAAHAEVRRAIEKKGLGASTITILAALMRLRQCCCDPRLLPGDAAREVSLSAKYDAFRALLRAQLDGGRRVLVFSQFARMLALMAQALRDDGIRHVMLTGATANRQAPIDAFENGHAEVFLLSLKAGGTGLNLTSADTVIHYDPWWNPAAQAQATDRAHRIGQTRPVFVHKLIVAGGVEEQMLRLQQRKQRLADSLLGTSAEAGPRLSESDVDRLFAPMRHPA